VAHLNETDQKILKYILTHNNPVTTNEIANSTKILWIDARKSLEKIHSLGYIKSTKQKDVIYWQANK